MIYPWLPLSCHRIAAASLVLYLLAAPGHAECRLQAGPTRTVTRAIDGETLLLDDGSQVRLAGVLAPRGSDAETDEAQWPLAVAARAALALLTEGHTVVLGYPGTQQTDRQGRHVAQVFVVEGGQETWVQGQLLCADATINPSPLPSPALQLRSSRGCGATPYADRASDAGSRAPEWP